MAIRNDKKKTVFLLGVGYIGGSILQELLRTGKYVVTALTRSEEKAAKLREIGVIPLQGSLNDKELIVKAASEHDIIIHAATADDQPSVRAILLGLEKRDSSASPSIYIHTSGTGVLCGAKTKEFVFRDSDEEEMNRLPNTQWHRDVDLLIVNAIRDRKVGSAKVAIMLPPTIYGKGDGPFNRLSIDIPAWIRDSIQNKRVRLEGDGDLVWNDIHIKNLVQGYMVLLDHLIDSPPPSLYYFCESGSHTWRQIADEIRAQLVKRDLLSVDAQVVPTDEKMGYAMGTYSRSKAVLLPEWGWKPDACKDSIYDAVAEEVEEIAKETAENK